MKLALVASTFAVLSLTILAGCAVDSSEESTESAESGLRKPLWKGCGPVRFEGEGTGADKGAAYEAAEKEARRICTETPSFCAVDCKSAPVTAATCGFVVVNNVHGDPPPSYVECKVTIEAQ